VGKWFHLTSNCFIGPGAKKQLILPPEREPAKKAEKRQILGY
jgi:hypothetical protein